MDYKSVLLECESRSEMYRCSNAVWARTHEENCISAINALLARAESAEARVHELETTRRVEMCEDGYDCVELGKVHRKLEETEARAEKAEKCITEIEEAMKFQRYSAVMLRISEYLCEKEG